MAQRVAIVGSHGLYGTYGGFDQLVKALVSHLSDDVELLIFNPVETPVPADIPSGVRIIRIPLSASGMVGIVYDFLSILLCMGRVDTILLLGVQGMPLLAFLRPFFRPRIVGNIGGIEWERPHLGRLARWFLKLSFDLSLKHAHAVVLDNEHYTAFLPENYTAEAQVIPYGGVIDWSLERSPEMKQAYPFLEHEYFLSVSRSIEDNKLRELCASFEGKDRHLVLISNFSNSGYGKDELAEYSGAPNMTLIDGLYEKPELDLVRRYCRAYIHTHTKCGTAPSLVEMVRCARPIISIDVPQNRYTLKNQGAFFAEFEELSGMLDESDEAFLNALVPSRELQESYTWPAVVDRYESLLNPAG